jgi:hypothetical protein
MKKEIQVNPARGLLENRLTLTGITSRLHSPLPELHHLQVTASIFSNPIQNQYISQPSPTSINRSVLANCSLDRIWPPSRSQVIRM